MSFDVNPSEWRPKVNTNRANATDNDGRGSSGGGGGFGQSAFDSKEIIPNDDELILSSQKKDIDEKMIEDTSSLFKIFVKWLTDFLSKFGIKFC